MWYIQLFKIEISKRILTLSDPIQMEGVFIVDFYNKLLPAAIVWCECCMSYRLLSWEKRISN